MTLGLLIGRFGKFVEEQAAKSPAPKTPKEEFPRELVHLRSAFGHHLVLLLLLARSDGEAAMAERQAVLRYCVERARAKGMTVSLEEQAALGDYLRDFHPSFAQFGPALSRLHKESKDDIAALLAAAHAVVEADGEHRGGELRLLEELTHDLAKL